MPQNHCADPFQWHELKYRKQLWKVSKKLVNEVNDPRLKSGDFLCIACKISLVKKPKSLPKANLSPRDEDNSPSSAPQAGPSSFQDEPSEPSVSTSLSDAEISREVTETVLPLIGVSPLTSSKLCFPNPFYCSVFLSSNCPVSFKRRLHICFCANIIWHCTL